MSNSFDFELVADDKVSGAIERINESLNDLQPKLDKTRTGLQFGGQETLDGLNGYNSRLELMAQSARDNVQYIGDMVPPLKWLGISPESWRKWRRLALSVVLLVVLPTQLENWLKATGKHRVRPITLTYRLKMPECG